MSRKFVYLLAKNMRHGQATFELRRINMSGLFYPTKLPNGSRDAKHVSANPANSIAAMELTRLPKPEIIFHPPASDFEVGKMQFMRFSSHNKDRIIGTDQRGNALLYNADLRTVRVMSSLNQPKNTVLSLTVGDSLYVMDSSPQPSDTMSFEVLSYGRPGNRPGLLDWYWHCLPPPPYVFQPGYEMQILTSSIRSYAVVGNSNIYISAKGIGTYSFDTATREWSKAGDWLLPFLGHAEYIPDHNLLFGLSYAGDKLCSFDMSAASMIKPPKLRNCWEWEADLKPPQDWVLEMSYVVHLGFGKYCVARFFRRLQKEQFGDGFVWWRELDKSAVFTGVEVERGGAGRGLRMVTHRSKRYMFVDKVFDEVL